MLDAVSSSESRLILRARRQIGVAAGDFIGAEVEESEVSRTVFHGAGDARLHRREAGEQMADFIVAAIRPLKSPCAMRSK